MERVRYGYFSGLDTDIFFPFFLFLRKRALCDVESKIYQEKDHPLGVGDGEIAKRAGIKTHSLMLSITCFYDYVLNEPPSVVLE